MRNDMGRNTANRKAWVAPELLVLSAGSAEQGGSQNIPDGGAPASPRS